MKYSRYEMTLYYRTHYAELHFGIPPQKASVIVDTGSHLTAMPCKK